MAENANRLDELRAIDDEYYAGVGYLRRWLPYLFTEDGIDVHDWAIDMSELQGNETIVDLGCGQGEYLEKIKQLGHTGLAVGLDAVTSLGLARHRYSLQNPEGISYAQVDGSSRDKTEVPYGLDNLLRPQQDLPDLPFATGTFNVSSAHFMLYETKDPIATIHELQRITTPDGKILISTSGRGNKPEHRKIEQKIEDLIGMKKPEEHPTHAGSFTSEDADLVLPRMFNTVRRRQQSTTIKISHHNIRYDLSLYDTDELSSFDAYVESLLSMNNLFDRIDTERWQQRPSFKPIIRQILEAALKEHGGVIEDRVERTVYELRDPKPEIFGQRAA